MSMIDSPPVQNSDTTISATLTQRRRSQASMLGFLLCALVPFALAGCASTYQARGVEGSGFLGDYSQFHEGGDGEALMVYLNPAAKWAKYKKMMIDPVAIYASEDGKLKDMPAEDRQELLNYLQATLREQLGSDYQLVDAAGPDTLHVRIAMTEAKGSKVVLDTFSSLVPAAVAISGIQRVASGSATAVGQASIEGEILDSATGERLLAAVDRRIGRKYTGKFDKFNQWHAAQDAFDYWAVKLKTRLAELRAGKAADDAK